MKIHLLTNLKQNGESNGTTPSIQDLEIETELKLRTGARNKIYDCLRNKLKTAYGYKWEI